MSSIFRGASAQQDSRFSDKAKKLLRTTKFPPNFDTKVDMKKVSLESLLPWITEQVTTLLGNDDDVVTGYIQVCPAPTSHLAHLARLRLAVPGLRRAGARPPSPHLDPRPHQGSLEQAKVDPKEMQLALAGFLDKHTAGFMRRCAVITAGPCTPVHPLTHPANPLQQPAHPSRSPPSPRPVCPLHQSPRLESHSPHR